jgi:hypothetical protein
MCLPLSLSAACRASRLLRREHEFFKASGNSSLSVQQSARARRNRHALTHRVDESPVGYSWRVALQQSPLPLHQPRLIVGERSVEGKNFFDPAPMGLNFLSHSRGAPQFESRTKCITGSGGVYRKYNTSVHAV